MRRAARWVCFAVLGAGAAVADSRQQSFADFTTPLPMRVGETLVIGFVGGWERWDANNRCVRRTALALRDRKMAGVFVETVENHRAELAKELVERAFDWNGNGVLDGEEKQGARVVLFGQSLGGRAVTLFARELAGMGLGVELAVLVDSVGRDDEVIPANVRAALNLYQSDDWPVHGETKIRAVDASKTKILGNVRFRYRGRKIEGAEKEPWGRRTFLPAHVKMEFDPEVWRRVEEEIVRALGK